MSKAKRHHYLSQFYLKGFQEENKNWVYDRETKKLRQDVPKNIAVISNLYTIQNEAGEESTEIESTFAIIEGKAVSILKKLDQGELITHSEKQELALFIALLSTRVPQFFKYIGDTLEAHIKSYSQVALADKERVDSLIQQYPELEGIDSEGIVEFVKEDKYKIKPTRGFLLLNMLKVGDEIAHYLFQMEWFILHSTENQNIVTNDAPFIILGPQNQKPPYKYGIGILNKNAVKIVPLTKCCILAIMNPGESMKHAELKGEQVARLNEIIALSSERLLIGSSEQLLSTIINSTNLPDINANERVSNLHFGNSDNGVLTITTHNVDAPSAEFLGDLLD